MSIVHDINTGDPGVFNKEYWLMVEMGWSWQQLLDTPFYVLDEVYHRLVFKKHWEAIRREKENG